MVTTFDLDEYVHQALANGASGFLLKDAGPALLVEAVRAAVRGDALVSPQVTVRLLRHIAETSPSVARAAAQARPSPVEALTEREEEALRLVARGHSNAEIGAHMFVSPSTVKTHLSSIQTKLGARNRVELAAYAWQSGRMT